MSVIVPKIEAALPISPLVLSPSLWYRAESLWSLADGADVLAWPDSSGNGRDVDTSVGTQTFKKTAANGRPAVHFGEDGYLYASGSSVQMDDLLDGSGRGSVFAVAWVAADHSGADYVWSQSGGNRGFYVNGNDDAFARAYDGTQDNATIAGSYAGAWHLFVWQFDGTNVSCFVDDIDDAAAETAASGSQTDLAQDLLLGGGSGGAELKGYVAEFLVVPGDVSEANHRRLAYYFGKKFVLEDVLSKTTSPPTEWTDVSEDVVSSVSCDWGVHGNGPKDRVADPGSMTFDLDNSKANSAGKRGYYTPGHVDVRPGFGTGLLVRLSLTHDFYGTKVKWVGTVESARAKPGVRDPRTSVRCVDWMEAPAKARLSGLAVQTDVQSDALFNTILAAMDEQPPNGKSVGSGSDIYPYALDNTQDEGAKVISELKKIAMSEFGYIYVDAGVLNFEGRRRRGGAGGIRFAMDETNITNLTATHGREEVLNRIQVSIHPRRVDSAATTVLFKLGSAIPIPRNTSVTINCPYRDPNQQAQRVGGVGMVKPVAGTDYEFNTDEDGGGVDITSQLSIVVGASKGGTESTPWWGGNSAELEITNNGPQDGYIPAEGLQLRGKGIYDFEPVISDQRDEFSVKRFGENVFSYDMPYQSSPMNALDTSTFILTLNKEEKTRVQTVEFVANWSDETVEQALNLRVADRVSVTLAELGLDARPHFVNGFRMRVHPSGLTRVTLDLAPVDTTQFWLLGKPGRTELDETTVLGYGFFVAGWILDESELGSETFLN